MSDLMQRLRYMAPTLALCGEAADEIERLTKLVEVLRAKLDSVRGHPPQMPPAIGPPDWGEGSAV